MRRSLWFNVMTIVGIVCWSAGGWQTSAIGEDAAAKPAATAEAHPAGESHPAGEHSAHDAEHSGDAHAADSHEAPKSPLEWKTDLALWTLITFVIFLIVLSQVAWKPLMAALEAREAGIVGNVENANKARYEAEKSLAEYQAKLQKAEDEVRQLLADARKSAEAARQEMLAATQKEVTTLKDRALAEIDQVRVQALEELFGHMASTVTKATEQVIRRSLTSADQERLVGEAVSQFAKR